VEVIREYLVNIYIPHSSDKTPPNESGVPVWGVIYIPHSSDKTIYEKTPVVELKAFTSLIVQIKRQIEKAGTLWSIYLHPS